MGGFLSHYDEDDLDETNSSNFDDINIYNNQPCSSSLVENRLKRFYPNFNCIEEDISSSKHFKLGLSPYVFKKLFHESCYSDVTIYALGHKWHLHRVYLEQCDYFKVLFNGDWLDSKKNEFKIEIDDENVTYAGFFNFFINIFNNYLILINKL